MAILFNGSNTRIDCGSASSVDNIFVSPGGTVMAWVYLNGWGEADFGRIADKSSSTGSQDGWAFYIAGNGDSYNDYSLRFQHGRTLLLLRSPDLWTTPASSIALSTWYHVACTFDKSSTSNDPALYINGVAQTISQPLTGSGSYDSDSGETLSWGNRSSATDRSFDGKIADARMYNRILSQAEIETICGCMGHDGIADGLVARWPMDDLGSGVTVTGVKDVSNNTNNGSPVNSPAFAEDILSLRKRRQVA